MPWLEFREWRARCQQRRFAESVDQVNAASRRAWEQAQKELTRGG